MSILFDGVADVKRTFGFDITYVWTLSESNTVHYIVRFVVYQFELDVFLIATYHFTCTIVVDVMCAEYGFLIIGTEWVELLQIIKEFRSDVPKVYLCIDIYDSAGLFRKDVF